VSDGVAGLLFIAAVVICLGLLIAVQRAVDRLRESDPADGDRPEDESPGCDEMDDREDRAQGGAS
jgi:hypothetical protein